MVIKWEDAGEKNEKQKEKKRESKQVVDLLNRPKSV